MIYLQKIMYWSLGRIQYKNNISDIIYEQLDIWNAKIWGNKSSSSLSYFDVNKIYWGRVAHICVIKLIIIGSDNDLSPGRRQAIIWTNAVILLIGPLGTNFSEISMEIHISSFKKTHLKMSSAKCRPSCLGLNVLRQHPPDIGEWQSDTQHIVVAINDLRDYALLPRLQPCRAILINIKAWIHFLSFLDIEMSRILQNIPRRI